MKFLYKIPRNLLSIVVTAAVLYLTLSPNIGAGSGLFSFPGADKVVHGIMFFALTAVYLFDYRKMKHLRPISGAVTVMIGIAAILLGLWITSSPNGSASLRKSLTLKFCGWSKTIHK